MSYYREENGQVVLTMSREDYERLNDFLDMAACGDFPENQFHVVDEILEFKKRLGPDYASSCPSQPLEGMCGFIWENRGELAHPRANQFGQQNHSCVRQGVHTYHKCWCGQLRRNPQLQGLNSRNAGEKSGSSA
jgi:hypothetical protein